VNRNPHRAAPKLLGSTPPDGEMSRDGRRAYFTNSPYASWDEIFYPHGVDTSMARIDADTEFGGRPWSHGSSGTVTTSGRSGCTRPASRPWTREATPTAWSSS
jgi:hypothetical protein